MAVPSAAAVGAFLALLHHVPRGATRFSPEPSAASLQHSYETCSSATSSSMATQQQQQSNCVQQVLAAHKQPSLLAALLPLLPSQQPWPCGQHQQHLQHVQSWQQLWPSQRRAFCSSTASLSKPAWPYALPSLHQPHKHSAGQLMRKPPQQPSPGAAAAAEGTAANVAATPAATAQNIWARIRIPFVMGVLSVTIPTALVITLRHILLGTTADYLRTPNPQAHKSALKQLGWWLSLQERFGESVVRKMVEYGIFPPLVGLVQPGTDALVLIEACELMKGLLDSPTAVAAMNQAGLQKAVNAGLVEGWVPTGALQAMTALQKALKG